MANPRKIDVDFVHYLESMVNLDALDRMTTDLDNELKDSERLMLEIKNMISSLPENALNVKTEPIKEELQENVTDFLTSQMPKLLLPDMPETSADVDIEEVLATMKAYTENMKKNFVEAKKLEVVPKVCKAIEKLDLEQYASSLDQLCKMLSNLKLNKRDEADKLNPDLEVKLTVLCEDVNMFNKLVQAKATLSKSNRDWLPAEQINCSLYYDSLIEKLLTGINEVTYLLHNKN